MALVPYDGSDISDSEEEQENESTSLPIKIDINRTEIVNTEIKNESLFNLPVPKKVEIITEEENDEFLQKKPVQEKKPVKITIPSLSQFDNDTSDEIPIKKYRPASTKGTGLFSILPPPKKGSNISLVPQIVKKPKPVQTPLVPRVLKKQLEEKIKQKIDGISNKNETLDEDEDDADDCTDFFSLDKPEPILPYVPEEEDNRMEAPAVEEAIPTVLPHNAIIQETIEPMESSYVSNNHLGLDETALKALIGSKGKRKLETAAASIVDLHENDIKPDNKEWYQNALLHGTGPEENQAVKAVPGGILKRKHQITYLAQQAKANEQQLKNMWAQNRASRQQTQSKYGF